MKQCPKCGRQVEEDSNAIFCLECGTRLATMPATPTPKAGEEELGSLIGDKNIINKSTIVAKQENKNFTAQNMTVINDEALEMVVCAVSGDRISKVNSAVCPVCGRDVSQQYMVKHSRRCQNCEEQAHEAFRVFAVGIVKGAGLVDAERKQQLDDEAKRLKIDAETREEVLQSLKQRSATAKSDVLSSLQRSEFDAAVRRMVGADTREDMGKSLQTLASLHENTSNDEVGYWYYLARAILDPAASASSYEKAVSDIYWQRYWGYLAYLNGDSPEAATAIEEVRKVFGDHEDDIRLAEVAYCLARGYDSFDQSMIDRAGALIGSVNTENLSKPLTIVYNAVQTIGAKGITLDNSYDSEDMFVFLYVFRTGKYVQHLYALREHEAQQAAEQVEREARQAQEEKERQQKAQQAAERARAQKQAALVSDASKRMADEMARLGGAVAPAKAKTDAKAFAGYDTPVPAKKSKLMRNILIAVAIAIVLIAILFLIPAPDSVQ